MKATAVLGAGFLSLGVSCAKEGPPSRPARSAQGQPTALSAAPPVDAGSGPYVLTAPKLIGYLKYQRARTALYVGLAGDLSKLSRAGLLDAGQGSTGTPASSAQLRILESRAKAEEEARAAAGLTDRDVRQIEAMATEVINARSFAKTFDAEGAIDAWEKMREKLPPQQRVDLDRSIGEMKKQRQDALQLTDARRQFGEANVHLLLTREDELVKNQNAWLSQLAAGAR